MDTDQKMIKIQGKIPREVGVAVSGGPDSMAVLDFLKQNHNVTAYYFNHETEHSSQFERVVFDYCESNNILLKVGNIKSPKKKKESLEEYWRKERYNWLWKQDQTIVIAHNLDDCLETYLFYMCNGKNFTIPYKNGNCIRPFRLTKKLDFVNWLTSRSVPYMIDPSNFDPKFKRSYIRNTLVPSALNVNPGLYKVIAKRIEKENLE